MKKNYTYKTQKGSEIKLEVEINHITEEENLADHNFTNKVSRYEYKVASITANGKSFSGKFIDLAYNIKIGQQGNQPILVTVPKEILDDFMADEAAEAKIKVDKMIAVEKKYQDHYNTVIKTMQE